MIKDIRLRHLNLGILQREHTHVGQLALICSFTLVPTHTVSLNQIMSMMYMSGWGVLSQCSAYL